MFEFFEWYGRLSTLFRFKYISCVKPGSAMNVIKYIACSFRRTLFTASDCSFLRGKFRGYGSNHYILLLLPMISVLQQSTQAWNQNIVKYSLHGYFPPSAYVLLPSNPRCIGAAPACLILDKKKWKEISRFFFRQRRMAARILFFPRIAPLCRYST